MIHIISKCLVYGLIILGALTVIKRAICEETKTIDYTVTDAVFSCVVLFLLYLSW